LRITLPREEDDPADPALRLMGFSALKALGMDTGMATISWFRRADGSAVITNAHSTPAAGYLNLMGLAHDVDIYRVWSEAVLGKPMLMPRMYAAGAAHFRASTDRLQPVLRELGETVVHVHEPALGVASSG